MLKLGHGVSKVKTKMENYSSAGGLSAGHIYQPPLLTHLQE
jgi:hypothetical protein